MREFLDPNNWGMFPRPTPWISSRFQTNAHNMEDIAFIAKDDKFTCNCKRDDHLCGAPGPWTLQIFPTILRGARNVLCIVIG